MKSKKLLLLYSFIAFFSILSATLVLAGTHLKQYQSVFLPGVTVSGTEIGGLSPEEASARIWHESDAWNQNPVEFYYEDKTYPVRIENVLTAKACQEQLTKIWQAEQARSWTAKLTSLLTKQTAHYSLQLDYTGESFQEITSAWQKDWNRPAENARITFTGAGFAVESEQTGLTVDVAATLAQLPADLDEASGQRYELIMQEELPEIVANDFKNLGEISSYSTNYNPGEVSRTHNLVQAASKIDGTVLKPGEEFSFNQTVGIRESATGFRDAMIIVNGRYEPGLGGGICQVSSTLYNTSLLAGLKITERHNHALAVAYVPVGRDATVVYGALDFRFVNTLADPIYIAAQASSGQVSISMYGNAALKKSISITNPIDQVIGFQMLEQFEPTLPPGTQKLDHYGANGYVVRTYRNYLDSEGKVIESEFLAKDTYQPLNQLTLVGLPVEEPLPDPKLNTDPADDNEAAGTVPYDNPPPPPADAWVPEPLDAAQPVESVDPSFDSASDD